MSRRSRSRRVLIAVTHLLGAGHLTRAAALARAFADAGHEVTLVSGGTPAALVSTRAVRAVRLLQLPPVRIAGVDFRTLLDEDGRPVDPVRLAARRDLLLATLAEVRPEVVITELFPFGRRVLADEFLALVGAAKVLRPCPLIAASVRDILVAPAKPGRVADAHQRLARFYDAVLVHGDPDLVRLEASWPVDDRLRALIRYTGYVDAGAAPPEVADQDRDGIVVSGGSSAVGLGLTEAALGAARLVPDRSWQVLLGAGVDRGDEDRLRALAPFNAVVERARPDFRDLLARAALSVSQAGYNTAVDVLATRVRAVFVPFEAGRETEQRLRAERFAARGWGRMLPEADLSADTLAAGVADALAAPRPSVTPPRLDGAEATVAIVEELLQWRRSALRSPAVAAGQPDWSALEEALVRAAGGGRRPALWWRDDDAVGHTAALDRLLALAQGFGIPVGLAVIPAGIEPSLAERLAQEPLASALVHGFAHLNHAPEAEKKAEFGPHRPTDVLARDAAAGLQAARDALGDKLLPVFVPPWNRAAPALLARLPGLGYSGVSTFGDRPEHASAPDLTQVNAHIDPIDWRGTRSLADPGALIAAMARAIAARTGARDPEPIGLLTHHRVHDEKVWSFCATLLERLSRSPHIGYRSPHDIFPAKDRSSVIVP